jgi:putative restriction endonuclease
VALHGGLENGFFSRPFVPAVRPKGIIAELGPLLRAKYSPIQPANGNGNQKAYLVEISQPAFDLIVERGGLDAMPAAYAVPEVSALTRADDEQEKAIQQDPGLDSTTKQQVVLARHGQGLFAGAFLSSNRFAD